MYRILEDAHCSTLSIISVYSCFLVFWPDLRPFVYFVGLSRIFS